MKWKTNKILLSVNRHLNLNIQKMSLSN